MEPRNPFNWRAPHHAYIGAFILALAWLMQPYELYAGVYLLFYAIGAYLVLDDLIEHTATRLTPLRLLFEYVLVPILDRLRPR